MRSPDIWHATACVDTGVPLHNLNYCGSKVEIVIIVPICLPRHWSFPLEMQAEFTSSIAPTALLNPASSGSVMVLAATTSPAE